MGRLSVFHQEKGEEVFPLEESPRAEASHGKPTSCVKSGIGGLTGRAASPAAARRSAPLPAIRHLEPQRDAFCPTSLRKVLLQLLQHHVRLRKLEFAWGPLLKTRPELRAWEERPREAQRLWNPAAVPRSHREAAVWRPPRPARTHCCRRRAATSPRSCPSAAWRGSPSPSARGPAGAAPGSGPRRCARRLVSSCCGERGEVRARPRPAAPAPRAAHQCSMTTLGPSTPPSWPPAGFSRFSAAAASAASAFRFLPRDAMAPGARLGTGHSRGHRPARLRAPNRSPGTQLPT